MPSSDLNTLAQKLKSLHVSRQPILLANVWDGASAAKIAIHPSTKALATASYAVAATQGVDDNDMTLEQNLQGIRNAAAGLRKAGNQTFIPLSADIQDGYSDPADTIRRVIELGVVGCNIEDVDNTKHELRSVEDAVQRIRTVANAAKEIGVPDFVINARTDVLGYGGDISSVIERGNKFLNAGATTVFVWGVAKWDIKPDEIAEMVKAFGGRLAVQPGSIGVEKLTDLGVSRISVGPALWRRSMDVIEEEAVRLNLLS
jgi:2-methylisocitrate lyase-like PEP mutase family enzyme